MTFNKSTSIGFIGAGAVGGSLAVALHNAGYPVVAVASRTHASAETFAARIPGCAPYRSLQKLADSVGFVFINNIRRRDRPGLRLHPMERGPGRRALLGRDRDSTRFRARSKVARPPARFTLSRHSHRSKRACRTYPARPLE